MDFRKISDGGTYLVETPLRLAGCSRCHEPTQPIRNVVPSERAGKELRAPSTRTTCSRRVPGLGDIYSGTASRRATLEGPLELVRDRGARDALSELY